MCVNSCAGQQVGSGDRWGCSSSGQSADGTSGSSAASPSDGSTVPTSTQQSIQQMEDAFNQAIQTNSEITSVKTTLGSIETVAQQRPNIG
jgi:hypothetical protein